MDEYESLSHSKWECKYHVVFISRRVHSQVPQEDALRRAEAASGRGVPQTRSAEGEQGRGRPSDAGSRSYDDFDSAEICGLAAGRSGDQRVHQEAGKRGYASGSDESVALTGHLQVAQTNRGRVSDPIAASSGPINKAPGSAGGYLQSPLSRLTSSHFPCGTTVFGPPR
jgi:hypothetical protein